MRVSMIFESTAPAGKKSSQGGPSHRHHHGHHHNSSSKPPSSSIWSSERNANSSLYGPLPSASNFQITMPSAPIKPHFKPIAISTPHYIAPPKAPIPKPIIKTPAPAPTPNTVNIFGLNIPIVKTPAPVVAPVPPTPATRSQSARACCASC